MKVLFRVLSVAILAAFLLPAAFSQSSVEIPAQKGNATTSVSGTALLIPNPSGVLLPTFAEKITGAPSTVSIVIQACMTGDVQGDNCVTLETNTSTAARQIRNPSTSSTVYDYFLVIPSWTGGTSPTVTINSTLSPNARNGGGAGATTAAQIAALFTGCSGTQYLGFDGACHSAVSLPIAESDVTSLAADLALKAPLASPTFTGTPAAPTAAVDTNTTQAATTAFVLAQSAAATPIIDGVAAVGTSTRYARADHVHPTDTTRAPSQAAAAVDNTIVSSAVTSGQPSFLGTSTTNVSVNGGTTPLNMWIGGQYQTLSSNVNVAVAVSPVGEYFVFAKQDTTNAAMVVGDFVTSNIAPIVSITAPTCSAAALAANPHYWFDLGTGLMKICTSNGGSFTAGTAAILIGVVDMNAGGTAVDQVAPMPFGASPGTIVRLFGDGSDGALSYTDGATHTKDGLFQVTSCFLANASTILQHTAETVAANTPGLQLVSQTPCMFINSAALKLDALGGAVKAGITGAGGNGNSGGFGGAGGAGGARASTTAGSSGGTRSLWYVYSSGGAGAAPAINTSCASGCNGANTIGSALALNAVPKPNCFEVFLGIGAGGGGGTGDGTNIGGSSGAGGGYGCLQAPSILVAGSASISSLGTTPSAPTVGIVGGGGGGAGGIIVENYGAIYGANIPTASNVVGGTGAAGFGSCGSGTCTGGNGGNGLVITRKII